MKISLCMIVKNEEHCLDRCLRSVRDCVDEMIIVDTGSTDRTVEIAKSFGARIYHHPWEGDFSKHRNQSLAYATGNWIFQLDADEELFYEDGRILREMTHTGNADYYHCRFYDMKKDGSIHGTFHLIRFFRNGMGMGYVRKVHNQLETCGVGGYSDIRVRHFGYDLSSEQMEAKHIRTTTLLMDMIAADTEDVYSLYQLSSSYSMHRAFDKAVAYGETALNFMRRKTLKNSYFLTVFYTVAQGYYALGRFEDAERVCLEALQIFPMHLDMCHLLANIYFMRKASDAYRATALRYLGIHEAIEKDPSLMGGAYCHSFARRDEIFFGLACIHYLEKDFETADDFFLKSFDESNRKMEKAVNIYRFYLEQKMDQKAFQWLKRTYETGLRDGNIPSVFMERRGLYLKMGTFFLQHNDLKAVADCLRNAEDGALAAHEQMEKRLLQLVLAWQTGETDEMLIHLKYLMVMLSMKTNRILQSIEELGQIIYDIAEVFCVRQQWSLAEAALRFAVQIAPEIFNHDRFNPYFSHIGK